LTRTFVGGRFSKAHELLANEHVGFFALLSSGHRPLLGYMGRLVPSLFNPSSCLPGRLEPGVLRPYRHVLQRGGRRAPTHNTVTSCLHFITSVRLQTTLLRRRQKQKNRHYQHHTCKRPLRRQARSLPPPQPASQIKCRQTVDISCMNWNHCMNRGRLYIYMTNNHMYVHTKTGVGPCTCDTNHKF